jgi:TRAP transporter TAXI family solute receptor
MIKKFLFSLIFFKLLSFEIVVAVMHQAIITIGTGTNSGNYFKVGKDFCSLVNSNSKNSSIKCLVKTTSGSVENIDLALIDKTSFGIAQADVISFHPKKEDLRIVARLYLEPIFIIASQNSEVREFDDILLQDSINIGEPKSGENATVRMIMKEKGWSKNVLLELNRYEIVSLLCRSVLDAKSLDVAFLLGGNPSEFVENLIKRCNVRLISIEDSFISQFISKYKAFKPFTIPAKSYSNQNKEIKTIAVEAVLFATKDTPEKLVKEVLESIFKDISVLQQSNLSLKNNDFKSYFKNDAEIPFHKGVEMFLKEVEQKNKTQMSTVID